LNLRLALSLLICCCLLLALACPAQVQKIYIKPKGAGIEQQSKFVDSIRFIPLEIIKDIELPSYTAIEFTRNYLLLRNPEDKVILLYSKDGRFVRRISYKKIGDSFGSSYDEVKDQLVFFGDNNNYSLTAKDRLQILLDRNNPRNLKYFRKYVIDLNDSNFLLRKTAPEEKDLTHAMHLYDDIWWKGDISTSPLFKDSLGQEFRLYRNDKLIKGYFPYDHYNEPKFMYTDEALSLDDSPDPMVHYLTRPFCDTVYKLVRDSLFPVYKLVLPLENSLPATFFSKPFKNKAERENYNRNNGWIFHQIYNFHETESFLSFDIEYLTRGESYIFQKQKNTLFNTKNIKPDSSQYNLKLLSDNDAQQEGDHYYKLVQAEELISFFDKNKQVPVPEELKAFIAGKPDARAPVVVEYKLKTRS